MAELFALSGPCAGTEKPLVALESTVIAHGLPHPHNLACAQACEAAVTAQGAMPATICISQGQVHVGCDEQKLTFLATRQDVQKLSLRDLAPCLAKSRWGATTVATSIYLAEKAPAPIHVFATGGIGGVHRGWSESADVSADLTALAASNLVVVCAGAKAILDLPKTREWLETSGVSVLGWGCEEMPAFYSEKSGLAVDETVERAADVARIFAIRRQLGQRGALLVCVPPPAELALPNREVDGAIDSALAAAKQAGIVGKETTPFLLTHVAKATEGKGLAVNLALLKQNASVAGEIAVAIQAELA